VGILNHIGSDVIGYTPGKAEFLDLVKQTLGDEGDPADGFDADLASVLLTLPATDAALSEIDLDFLDLVNADQVLEAVDTSSLVDNFATTVPVIDAFNYTMQLKTVGALQLPAPLPLPSGGPVIPYPQPPVCVPVPVVCTQPPGLPAPPPTPQPPPQPCAPGFVSTDAGCAPAPSPLPLPVPVPSPEPCPPGFISTQQGCLPIPPGPPTFPIPRPPIIIPGQGVPCPPGFIATDTGCVEQPPAPQPAPPPTPQPPLPPIGPAPEPQPCMPGFVSTAQGCQPLPGIGGGGIGGGLPVSNPVPCGLTGSNAICADPLEGFVIAVPGTCGDGQVCVSDDPFALGNWTIDPGFLP
jgi:hypothetical protein